MKHVRQFFAIVLIALGSSLLPTMANEGGHEIAQPLCPVMEGNSIDQSIYVDYEGKRVYFCCNVCKGAFEKEPGKYLSRLPQFADTANEIADPAHEHQPSVQFSGLRLHRFTRLLGISTFLLLVMTLCAGLLRRKLRHRFLRIHRTLAFTTVVVAALHALTVILGH